MAKRFSEKQRAALLAGFERWEGSAAAFCRRHGVSYQSLRGWRRTSAAGAAPVEAPRFLEVELRRGPVTPVESPRAPVAELELGLGVILRVYPIQEGRP
jgi:transposase-like protein